MASINQMIADKGAEIVVHEKALIKLKKQRHDLEWVKLRLEQAEIRAIPHETL